MSAIAPIVIADDPAAANDRSFDPVAINGTLATWRTSDMNTWATNPSMSFNVTRPTVNRKTTRVTWKLDLPKELLDADTGMYYADDVGRFEGSIVVPNGFDTADRLQFAWLIARLSTSVPVFDSVELLEGVY